MNGRLYLRRTPRAWRVRTGIAYEVVNQDGHTVATAPTRRAALAERRALAVTA